MLITSGDLLVVLLACLRSVCVPHDSRQVEGAGNPHAECDAAGAGNELFTDFRTDVDENRPKTHKIEGVRQN